MQIKKSILRLSSCTIEAYPSYHLDAYRALDNSKFILLDEADFFRKSEQEDVRPSSFRTLYCNQIQDLKANENFRNPDTQLRRNSIGLDKEPNFKSVCILYNEPILTKTKSFDICIMLIFVFFKLCFVLILFDIV